MVNGTGGCPHTKPDICAFQGRSGGGRAGGQPVAVAQHHFAEVADMRFVNVAETLVYARVGKEMYQRRGGWKYFASEARLQGYMLSQKIISYPTYISNVAKRLIVQVLLPNSIRGWVFRKFARSNAA